MCIRDRAIKGGYAIPAFNFNNMEQMQAIIKAAVETKSPVILYLIILQDGSSVFLSIQTYSGLHLSLIHISVTSSSIVIPYSTNIPCINPVPTESSTTFPSFVSFVSFAKICPSLSE